MTREKSIQITQKLFLELAQYFLLEKQEPEREEAIKKGLSDKLEAMIKRDYLINWKP